MAPVLAGFKYVLPALYEVFADDDLDPITDRTMDIIKADDIASVEYYVLQSHNSYHHFSEKIQEICSKLRG